MIQKCRQDVDACVGDADEQGKKRKRAFGQEVGQGPRLKRQRKEPKRFEAGDW